MELVDTSCDVEKRLFMECSEAQALNSNNNEMIDKLNADIQSLTANTKMAVSAVEARWRAKSDDEKDRFRKTEEELRRKLAEIEDERAQLMYVGMANEKKMSSHMVESSSMRQNSGECERLRAEVSRLTGVLEAKSSEMSTAMVTFAELQRMTVEREGELKAKLISAESK